MIKFMATDFGNVLGTYKPRVQVLREIASALSQAHGCKSDKDISTLFLADTKTNSDQEMYYDKLDRGEMSARDLWQHLLVHLGLEEKHCTYDWFRQYWCSHQKPIVPMVKLYREIQNTYPLIGISNGDTEALDYFTTLLTEQHKLRFFRTYLSGKRRLKKPGLFQIAAFELLFRDHIEVSDCIYVDDLGEYVQRAARIGFMAFQFDATSFPSYEIAANTLRAELISRGMNLAHAQSV